MSVCRLPSPIPLVVFASQLSKHKPPVGDTHAQDIAAISPSLSSMTKKPPFGLSCPCQAQAFPWLCCGCWQEFVCLPKNNPRGSLRGKKRPVKLPLRQLISPSLSLTGNGR